MVGTHDSLVDLIDGRLNQKSLYNIVAKEQEFYNHGNTLMEVDNYAIRVTPNKTYLLLFEDKSSDKHKHKAETQLAREYVNYKKILDKHGIKTDNIKIFMFYVHNHKHPTIERITFNVFNEMKEQLYDIAYSNDIKDFDTFYKISHNFQDNFLHRFNSLNNEQKKEILNLYQETYKMKW
jgi:hypothetical protein